MVRIAGVNLPGNKPVYVSLTYIYGIGDSLSGVICDACCINRGARTFSLSDEEIIRIRNFIRDSYVVEGDLRKQVGMDIKFLVDSRCYRGIRHSKGLPVRGQRTRTNARTRKGKARLPVAAKKK